MSTVGGRQIGIAVVLILLAGAGVLAALPHGAAAMRIGSLSLLWWYAAVVAPLLAVVVTACVLVRRHASEDSGSPAAPPA